MAMDLSLFRCPACKNSSFSENPGFLLCRSCGARYTIFGRSIDFIEDAGIISESQQAQKKHYEEDPTSYVPIDINVYLNDVIGGSRRKSKTFISFKQYDIFKRIKKLKIQQRHSVLEVGCFDGRYCFLVEKLAGAKCYGIDLARNAVLKAVQHSEASGLRGSEFHVGLGEKIPFVDGAFDRVISLDVLEHVHDKESFLSEVHRVLRPGGEALLYAISRNDRHSLHWTLRESTKGALGRDEGGGHVYDNFAHPDEIRKTGEKLGIRRMRLTPFHGFFSLFLDEYLSRRLGYKVKYLFGLARFLDTPLYARDIGNGFYINIKK